MKLRKILLGGAAAVLALSSFAFLSCSTDSEEDDELIVSINPTYNSDKSSATVTMTLSETTYGDSSTKVYIAYTTDGSEPTVEIASGADLTKVTSSTSISDLKQYVNYGSADIYETSLTFKEDTTINAEAFYISGGKLYHGPIATKAVDVTETTDTTTSTSKLSTDGSAYDDNMKFSIASSGNSYSIHYFDTSSYRTFTYTDTTNGNTTYDNCYYQIQFSYKKDGAGNWYMYIRKVGQQAPIGNSTTGTKYLVSGTYSSDSTMGSVFDKRASDSVNDGTFTLLDNGEATFASNVSMSKNTFTLPITADTTESGTTTKGNLTTAIENAK